MEKKKIERLYELLESKKLDEDEQAALRWAIFELEKLFSKEL